MEIERRMDVVELGAGADYRETWALQRALHAQVVDGARPTLLLLEHASVYTAGTSTQPGDLPTDGSEAIEVDRGGRITWHGPGQLVAYPIVALPDAVQVVDWVRRLEEAIIRALAASGLATRRIRGRAGVWVADASGERKVAQVGVRVASRASMHGIAINVANSLAPFTTIVPCGIADAGVTTVELETGSTHDPMAIGRRFAAELEPLLDFAPFTSVALDDRAAVHA
ncbi:MULTISPECIES: lipoyl(octanoyl) transferase LipB [Agrococcus]|uniref:lipoyl(octanoyl) transferase LipB n=1 Tax=Agrococcus TaxID=46352 RepID=UPI001CED268F|nr:MULTISPECIES: lipoyl(octanoyl) transferase LipB [Agrococcus]UOW01235.1 lipoyl(octanoyl) transferase LipB [Agrococcus sp. SCSIO52902]